MQPAWQPPPPLPPEDTTNGAAIAALVTGILGITCLPLVGSLAAVPLGHVALVQIRRTEGRQKGHGMAIAGLVLGYLVLAFAAFVVAGNVVLQFVE